MDGTSVVRGIDNNNKEILKFNFVDSESSKFDSEANSNVLLSGISET